GAAPYNIFIDTSLIGLGTNFFNGFYLEWTTGDNIGESSFVASYNESTGEITTVTDFTNPIQVGDKFIMCQVIDFTHASDFGDPENVLAEEVIAAINSQLLGGRAELLEALNSVRLRTSNFQSEGKIQVKGGTANAVLGFSTEEQENQLTNLANVVSNNSDLVGNALAPGYTL